MSRESWEVSEAAEQQEYEISHGEVDKNGCYPGQPMATHKYPLLPTGRIIDKYGTINWKWKPF